MAVKVRRSRGTVDSGRRPHDNDPTRALESALSNLEIEVGRRRQLLLRCIFLGRSRPRRGHCDTCVKIVLSLRRGMTAMARNVLPLLTVLGTLSLAGGNATAHHSVAGQFDASTRMEITGVVSKVDWINPHVYIHIDVPDAKGAITTWRLESLPTAMLRKAGLTSEMLKGGGQKVTAAVILARNGTPNLGWLLNLTYEDGHEYVLAGE
jgi:hypothetical protein